MFKYGFKMFRVDALKDFEVMDNFLIIFFLCEAVSIIGVLRKLCVFCLMCGAVVSSVKFSKERRETCFF